MGGEARTAGAGLLWGATGQTVRSINGPVAHLEGIVRVRFEYKETAAAVLHGRRRTASSLPMTGRGFRPRPHFTEKQRLTGKIANEVRPCDGKPPSRPHQWRLWHVRFRPRHPSNRAGD